MLVTAKLSKAFYDRMGEEVANELVNWFNAVDATDRSDLRELNELNFARFDAKLEQRLAQLRVELCGEIGQLRREFVALRGELRGKIRDLRTESRTGLAATKASLVKWMFVFLSGWAVAVFGVLKYWR